MRRAAILGLLLVSGGCLPQGRTAAGLPTGVGVLVQATTDRCTTVLVGITPRRVCAPTGAAAEPQDSTVQETEPEGR